LDEASPIGPAMVVFGIALVGTLLWWHGRQQTAAQNAANSVSNSNIDPATGYVFGSAADQAVNGSFLGPTALTIANSQAGSNPATAVNLTGSQGG
jgi:hypothetical protein